MKRALPASLALIGAGILLFYASMAQVTPLERFAGKIGVLPFISAGFVLLGVIGLIAWLTTLMIVGMAPKPLNQKENTE